MSQENEATVLIAAKSECLDSQSEWGHGGWISPLEREALDWMTLVRFMGWSAKVVQIDELESEVTKSDGFYQWIIIACDPDCLNETAVAALRNAVINNPTLVIARAGKSGSPLARLTGVSKISETCKGQSIVWHSPLPFRDWQMRRALEASLLDVSADALVLATLENRPLIASTNFERGSIATIGFHPSEWRDADGGATTLLKDLLVYGSLNPTAWLDWSQTMVLRMDDPGGAQNIHCKQWFYPKLGEKEWAEIGEDLKKRAARLSICYVAGWVDDGNAKRGKLEFEAVELSNRTPGKIYPSPFVKYTDLSGFLPGTIHDYASEYKGIQSLRSQGLAEVELHGYTHMHPETELWAKAEDRYEGYPKTFWYRELSKATQNTLAARTNDKHPLALGIRAFQEYFGIHPTTLVCPGDMWSADIPQRALDLNFQLLASYYLAIRNDDRFCWTTHVCAPYLDKPEDKWFDAALPVVGYFHDRELALEGVAWMSKWLDSWQAAGAKQFMDFSQLAAALSCQFRLEQTDGSIHLLVANKENLQIVRPLAVNIYVPKGKLSSEIKVVFKGQEFNLSIESKGNNSGSIILPLS